MSAPIVTVALVKETVKEEVTGEEVVEGTAEEGAEDAAPVKGSEKTDPAAPEVKPDNK